MRIRAPSVATLFQAASLVANFALPGVAGATDWLQFGFDASHSGFNPEEHSVARNLASMQLAFVTQLPAKSDGAPVYAKAVPVPNGARDMVFVTTDLGHLVAADAQSGDIVWVQQPATGPATETFSSPVIDPNRLYVYSFGLDGKVHKYAIGTGSEVVDSNWPEIATLKPDVEKGSSALTFATATDGTTYLYATTSNITNDAGDYQGHITAINLASGAQTVFNTLCSDQNVHFSAAPAMPNCSKVQSGIWGRPGVTYLASTDRIYVTTGNGPYSGATGGNEWGMSVLALTPSLRDASAIALTRPLDSYTPPEYSSLNAIDSDLGQTIPAIMPAPVGSRIAHPGMQLGKDGIIRLLDLDNMSGAGGPGHLGGELQQISGLSFVPYFSSQPAVWVDPATQMPWLFTVNNGAAYGFVLMADAAGNPGLVQMWSRTANGGSSAVVADGLVFFAEQSSNLVAVDAKTGTQVWSAPTSWAHWASPIVVDGRIFFADQSGTLQGYAASSYAGADQLPAPLHSVRPRAPLLPPLRVPLLQP